MIEIIKLRLQGLWNSEYPWVISLLITILEKFDAAAIRLGLSYERLAAFRPQLEQIIVQERADKESAELSELDQRRDTLYNVIYSVAKAFQRAPEGELSNHAHRVVTAFKKHGLNIATTNYTAETKRMNDLIADVSAQCEVMESLRNLSLLSLFDQMSNVNKKFEELFIKRNFKRGEAERIDIRTIRLECDKAVTKLWSAIEFNMTEYGVAEYEKLVKTINEMNSYYKKQLAARATRRKAKQAVETEEPIAPYTVAQ